MQEIVQINTNKSSNSNSSEGTHSIFASSVFKNKSEKAVFAVLAIVFCVSCAGVFVLSDELLSIGGLQDYALKRFPAQIYEVFSLFLEFLIFSFALFPFLLGVYAYTLELVTAQGKELSILFLYYKSRSKYMFAVRLAFHVMLVLLAVLAFLHGVSSIGIGLSRHFVKEQDFVRATLFLVISFSCVCLVLAVAFLRLCDLFAVVSLSSIPHTKEASFKDICRASAFLVKGRKKRIVLNFIASVLRIFVAVFSAGLLIPVVLPRVAVSRALLERDIISEYKNKNNI